MIFFIYLVDITTIFVTCKLSNPTKHPEYLNIMTIKNDKDLVTVKLKEMGFNSIEEALNFGKETSRKIKENYEPEWCENTEQEAIPQKHKTNVAFMAGQTASETKIYAFDDSKELDIELSGITKASLSYDPDLDLPVLQLEIINPVIM